MDEDMITNGAGDEAVDESNFTPRKQKAAVDKNNVTSDEYQEADAIAIGKKNYIEV